MQIARPLVLAVLLVATQTHAQSVMGGLGGLGEAGQRYFSQQQEYENQRALILQQHELEMQRIKREYDMKAQADERDRLQRVEQAAANRRSEQQQEIQLEEERKRVHETNLRQVETAHPGWVAITRSEDFDRWRKQQPPSIQALGDSERASDAILMIDLYKRDQKVAKTNSKKAFK